jgi:hypothetical protein
MAKQEIAKQETETAPALPGRFTQEQIDSSALHGGAELPALAVAKAAPIPMNITYWQPLEVGESIRGWVLGVGFVTMPDMESGELKDLESVLFVQQGEDGTIRRLFNASRILVANIKDAIQRGEIIPASRLTPVVIIYRGEKKNSTNAFKSKVFDILPLIVSSQ